MIKITSSILAFFILSSLALASDDLPIYNQAQAVETKSVIALSQILDKDHMFEVDTRIQVYGRKGFFSSFGENNDLDWDGSVMVTSKISKCFSEEYVQNIQKEGYIFKSRTADITVAGYRAVIRELRKSGAKYVSVSGFAVKLYDDNNQSTNAKKDSFTDYFQKLLVNKEFENKSERNLPSACLRDTSIHASDVFWVAGQVAALAIGVKGASTGNTNMTSLASNMNLAASNHSSTDGKINLLDQKKAAGIKMEDTIWLHGYIDPLYFKKRFPDNKFSSSLVSIEEIEEVLSHYPAIPYGIEKITSN